MEVFNRYLEKLPKKSIRNCLFGESEMSEKSNTDLKNSRKLVNQVKHLRIAKTAINQLIALNALVIDFKFQSTENF